MPKVDDPLLTALSELPQRQARFKDWLAEQSPERRDAILDAIYGREVAITSLEILLRSFGASVSKDTLSAWRRRGRPVA